MMKKIILIIGIAISLLMLGCANQPSSGGGELDSFATCLTESGAKMYGAFWCPHCKDQKAGFGESWDKVNYIECSLPSGQGQTAVCQQAGIQGYPTWEFADGERASGNLPHADLARITGCPLP
jgi:uncharacterized lipoprotein NlpE involved in copper resistance